MEITVRILIDLLAGAAGIGIGWHFGFWTGWFRAVAEYERAGRLKRALGPLVAADRPLRAHSADDDESDSMFGDDAR